MFDNVYHEYLEYTQNEEKGDGETLSNEKAYTGNNY